MEKKGVRGRNVLNRQLKYGKILACVKKMKILNNFIFTRKLYTLYN